MNVCNMHEIATIKIHKHEGRYYLNFIAYDDVAEKLQISYGLWTDVEIPCDVLDKVLSLIFTTDYIKDLGRELDYMTTINGRTFKQLTRENKYEED